MEHKEETPVITEGRKVQKTVTVHGIAFNLIIHMKNYQYSDHAFEVIDKVTNEAGEEVEGAWNWDTHGVRVKQK